MPPRASYQAIARQKARQYGVPENIAFALIRQESGWRVDARSNQDAVGLMQIHLPSHPNVTRQQALDPEFNIDYGMRYLAAQYKSFGKWNLALAAYNAGPGRVANGEWKGIPETANYVKNVLAMAGDVKPRAASSNATATPALGQGSSTTPMSFAQADLSGAMLEGLADISSGNFDPVAQLSRVTLAHRQQADLAASGAQTPVATEPGVSPAPQPTTTGDWEKWVNVPPARGSTSKPHQPGILSWVGGLAQAYGKPLAVWDNTTHSKMTVNGNVSAHYDGNAADIPATGAKLQRLGYLALVRAGMSPKEARVAARRGGLLNVGGYQIIFKTKIGGNHWDHLHVGIRS